VANLPAGVFLAAHGETIGPDNARRIHARARQVHFAHLFVHTLVFEAVNADARTI
jgi:hypothetical protein